MKLEFEHKHFMELNQCVPENLINKQFHGTKSIWPMELGQFHGTWT